ncbi:GNAT family N-acetyltransferase [Profundibacterium mesophilum]|uniref:Acetyltransferase domain containing protein n=1 Tax=Profundibacterium mesophilum KAUST100406-0324 TaxID=1037889 RepID=A0A921NSR0_9RHOB|nr:GNAT family N-acetyltransferase [Profundibacterium mesophilum]KAF0677252.1 Acetyltransferase domain containing protein [Profundibacterium mesophilum KAUST100406-0324]
MPGEYRFRPLVADDRRLFDRWLAEPHMEGWWGDADTEWAQIMREWAAGGDADMRIVEHEGYPFAYVQDYDAHSCTMPHYAHLPKGTRAMDAFLGDRAYLGRGHAAAFLRQRALRLAAKGAPLVAVDPAPGNARAIAAYGRAGFSGAGAARDAEGRPVRVMTLRPR